MSDAVRFLTGLTQALSSSLLYGEEHPAYRRAIESAFRQLQDLQRAEGTKLEFSLLDGEVVFGLRVVHELRAWEWTPRLVGAGIQRIEVTGDRTLEIGYRKDRVNAGDVLAALQAEGLGIVDVSTRDPDLEDVFLSLTREAV